MQRAAEPTEPGIREVRRRSRALRAVKCAHTAVWALLAGCVLAMPIASWRGDHRTAIWLAAIVAAEVVLLLVNHRRCPLTTLAARYTDERGPAFDIFLPVWLAKHNQAVFGTLYFAALVYAVARWE